MDRRRALRLLAALGTTGLAAACGTEPATTTPETAPEGPIRIGMIAPLTGDYKAIGDELVNGFQLFLDLNGRRLGDHSVELVTADEGETAESGKTALDSLVKRDVIALTGVATSTVMLAIQDGVERARIPLLGSNASPSALRNILYVWRTSYRNDEPGRALGPYVAQRVPRNGRVLIVAADDPANHDIADGFRKGFGASDPRLSGSVIWTDPTTGPGRNAYASAISEALESDPDALFCCFLEGGAVAFLEQLYAAGYRKAIYGPGFLTEGGVLTDLKAVAAEGIMTSLNYSADLTNPDNRVFASAYREAHGNSPTTYATASYDAALVLDKAIRFAGGRPTAHQVNVALARVGQIDSPRGPWEFNEARTPQQKWYLRRVQPDGQVLSNVIASELATLG